MWYNIDTIKKGDNEMKIIYQADDGARFESELECIEYERSRKICNAISERKLRILSYNAEVMRERDFLNHRELKTIMESIYYFHCNDKKVLEILSEFFTEDFQENVTYCFNEEDDAWTELDDDIYNYQSLLNDLLEAKTTIMDGITQ
jgi:hypothetical protein